MLCASPAITLADECRGYTNWNVRSGDWFEPRNWDPHQVPDYITSAYINNAGTATIASTGAESCDLTLGGSATESGTLVVNQGSLHIHFDAAVGGYGTGVLTITNGGTVTAALATIARVAGSNGAATVDTNSQWTLGGELDVGATSNVPGTGLLTVTNGGTVTAASVHVYSSGTLTGNGTVSTTTTSGTTVDGTLEPTGTPPNDTLTISGTGGLVLHSSAATVCNVVPSGADNIQVSGGAATLNGRLLVTMTGTFTCGTTYTLLHADGGRFDKFLSVSITFPSGQNFTPQIIYYTDHVDLYLACNTN